MDAHTYNFYRSEIWKRRNIYEELVFGEFFEQIENAYLAIKKSFDSDGKLLIFGNGGSATEADHFAAELVCKFEKIRKAIPAIAITTSPAILTAQSNDDDFDSVFVRQIEALGKPGDTAMGITTSDAQEKHSTNIFRGFLMAKTRKMTTVGLVSKKTQWLLKIIDHPIIIPHESTDIIQEAHRVVVHILCKRIESEL